MRVTMTGVSEEIIRRSRASTEEDRSQEPVREAEDRARAWPETGPGLGRDWEVASSRDKAQTWGTTIKTWMGTNLTTIKMTRDREDSRITTAIRAARDLVDTNSLVTTTLTDNSREEALEGSQQVRTMAPLLPMEEDNSREETLVDSSWEVTLVENSLAHLALDSVDSSRMETLVESKLMKTMALLDLVLVVNSRDREVLLLESRPARIMGLHHQLLTGSNKEATLVDNSREVTLVANRLVKTMALLDLTPGDCSRLETLVETTLVDSKPMMTMAPLDQTSVVNSKEKTLVDSSRELTLEDSSREVTLVDNSRKTTLVDNRLERTMAHLDQTTGDSSREVTLVDNSRVILLVDNSREVTLVDNKLERTMAPLDQTLVDSSQAATLVDSSQEATLVDRSREDSLSLAPREATDSQPRECSQARTMGPQTLDLRTSQLPLILS